MRGRGLITCPACCALALLALAGAAAAEPVQARWAADLVDSVGVNTHFADPSSGYRDALPLLLARLRDARIRHLRDGAITSSGRIAADDAAPAFRTLGRAGLRVDFIVRAGVTPGFVQDFPARVAPALEMFELPNEPNHAVNDAWAAPLRAWATQFRALVDQAGGRAPIIGPALVVLHAAERPNPYAELGDISAAVDFGNVHDYTGGREPGTPGWGGAGGAPCQTTHYGSLAFLSCYAAAAFPGRRMISTETGWGTDLTRHTDVPEDVQAKYVVRSVLVHFAAGFARTYLYQLMEAGTDGFQSYGLLRADGAPKPAFLALSALLRRLDKPERPSVEAAGEADIEISAAGSSDVRRVLLRRSTGAFVLILWIEAPSFDPDARGGRGERVAVEPRSVGVRVHGLVGAAHACTIQGGNCAPSGLHGDGDGFAVALTDSPTLVEFRADPPGMTLPAQR